MIKIDANWEILELFRGFDIINNTLLLVLLIFISVMKKTI